MPNHGFSMPNRRWRSSWGKIGVLLSGHSLLSQICDLRDPTEPRTHHNETGAANNHRTQAVEQIAWGCSPSNQSAIGFLKKCGPTQELSVNMLDHLGPWTMFQLPRNPDRSKFKSVPTPMLTPAAWLWWQLQLHTCQPNVMIQHQLLWFGLKHVGCSGELAGCSFSADGFDEELKCFGLLHHGILWPFSQVEAEGDKREEGTESLPVSSIYFDPSGYSSRSGAALGALRVLRGNQLDFLGSVGFADFEMFEPI